MMRELPTTFWVMFGVFLLAFIVLVIRHDQRVKAQEARDLEAAIERCKVRGLVAVRDARGYYVCVEDQ